MGSLIYKKEGNIGRLTLNRPDKYNAFDKEMVTQFDALLNELRYDETTTVLVIDGGSAKGFCAGLDTENYATEILAMSPVKAYDAQAEMSRLFLKMRQIPQPVISCIHGAAAGIGFSIAMASDIRVITENARFSAAYINIGLGGADMSSSYFLPRLIGAGRAYEFLLTGNWMSSQESVDLGFVSKIVENDALIESGMAFAKIMTEKSPLGIRMTKEAINANLDCAGLEAALQMEDRNQMMITYTYRMK